MHILTSTNSVGLKPECHLHLICLLYSIDGDQGLADWHSQFIMPHHSSYWSYEYLYSAIIIYRSSKSSSNAPCFIESHSFNVHQQFYTCEGRARLGTLHPQRISKHCYTFRRSWKNGSLSLAISPEVEFNLKALWLNMHLSRYITQLS
jgi:hypothetical protein